MSVWEKISVLAEAIDQRGRGFQRRKVCRKGGRDKERMLECSRCLFRKHLEKSPHCGLVCGRRRKKKKLLKMKKSENKTILQPLAVYILSLSN